MTPEAARIRVLALLERATHAETPVEEARTSAMIACKLLVEHELLSLPVAAPPPKRPWQWGDDTIPSPERNPPPKRPHYSPFAATPPDARPARSAWQEEKIRAAEQAHQARYARAAADGDIPDRFKQESIDETRVTDEDSQAKGGLT